MGEMVSYRGNGGTERGLSRVPAGGAASPAVIVIQEWWGLVPHIRSVADRFAEAGFVALAPDFYHGELHRRAGRAPAMLIMAPADGRGRERHRRRRRLPRRPARGRPARSAAVGFCAGGSLALWSATLLRADRRHRRLLPGACPGSGMRPDWADYAGKAALIHCSEEDGTLRRRGRAGASAGPSRPPAAPASSTTTRAPRTRSSTTTGRRRSTSAAAASAWARTLELFRAKLG